MFMLLFLILPIALGRTSITAWETEEVMGNPFLIPIFKGKVINISPFDMIFAIVLLVAALTIKRNVPLYSKFWLQI